MKNTNNASLLPDSNIVKTSNFNLRINIFAFILVVFVAIASIQAFQLSHLISEARDIGKDVSSIHMNQEFLLERYSFIITKH